MLRYSRGSLVLLWIVAAACGTEDDGDSGGDAASATETAMTAPTGSPTGSPSGSADDAPSDGTTPGTSASETAESTGSNSGGTTGGTTGDSGSESGPEELVGCYDYDAFVPTAVGYRADVMPIFAARCASCHQDPDASTYYGMGGTSEAEATAIYDKLLEGVPKQAPHLSFIVPFDPVRSYMMAKVEYEDPGGTCSVIVCMEPGCELQAPPAGQLPEPELAVLRSWVMGGALDD